MIPKLEFAQPTELPIDLGFKEEWMGEAACRGLNPDLFFPNKGRNIDGDLAKQVCAQCVVVEECLDYAIRHRQRIGIWGGTTERQRRKIGYGRE